MGKTAGAITSALRTLLAKTCLNCGEFRQASEFAMMQSGYYQSSCIPCLNVDTNKRQELRYLETLAKATRRGTEWTEPELLLVQKLTNEGVPVKHIAMRLNRTLHSIANVKQNFGIRKRKTTFKAKPGQPIDTEFIRSYIEENVA